MTPPTPPQERFLDESVLADFTAMRMTAFGKSVIDIANDPAFDTWTFSQKVLYALDDMTEDVSPFKVVPRSHLSFHKDSNPYMRCEYRHISFGSCVLRVV